MKINYFWNVASSIWLYVSCSHSFAYVYNIFRSIPKTKPSQGLIKHHAMKVNGGEEYGSTHF
jgi:hypothetical protein